jgi:hypothetical protein
MDQRWGEQTGALCGRVRGAHRGRVGGALRGRVRGALRGRIRGALRGRVRGALRGRIRGALVSNRLRLQGWMCQFACTVDPTLGCASSHVPVLVVMLVPSGAATQNFWVLGLGKLFLCPNCQAPVPIQNSL